MSVKLLTEHHLEVSKLKSRLQRFVRVYTCQIATLLTLLEITCRGSNVEITFLGTDAGIRTQF